MEKIYKWRPIEKLLKLEEVEDWEWPNEEMELFPYKFEDKRNTNSISNVSELITEKIRKMVNSFYIFSLV